MLSLHDTIMQHLTRVIEATGVITVSVDPYHRDKAADCFEADLELWLLNNPSYTATLGKSSRLLKVYKVRRTT